jgi:hypothetical protein
MPDQHESQIDRVPAVLDVATLESPDHVLALLQPFQAAARRDFTRSSMK